MKGACHRGEKLKEFNRSVYRKRRQLKVQLAMEKKKENYPKQEVRSDPEIVAKKMHGLPQMLASHLVAHNRFIY